MLIKGRVHFQLLFSTSNRLLHEPIGCQKTKIKKLKYYHISDEFYQGHINFS